METSMKYLFANLMSLACVGVAGYLLINGKKRMGLVLVSRAAMF